MFERRLDLSNILKRKSVLLLGPRQTGKSTYLRQRFPAALFIDLLDTQTQMELMRAPYRLRELIRAHAATRATPDPGSTIIIDEIQKIPLLLDEVHAHIEAHPKDRFILSGSSARRLKVAGTNLLGGRATLVRFAPIVHPERSSSNITWQDALQWGGLPAVLLSSDRRADLMDYVGLYLQEEIKAEGLTRNLATFSRFLEVAASTNTELVVYQSLSTDVGVSATTIKEYYQILEDTLVGERLPPLGRKTRSRVVAAPKFYLFDTGVAHAVLRRWTVRVQTPEYGTALEQLIYCELRAFLDQCRQNQCSLYFWRTYSKVEIDFIVETADRDLIAIEVKATAAVTQKHLKPLRKIIDDPDLRITRRIVVCTEANPRMTEDNILILPVESFMERLWAGEVV